MQLVTKSLLLVHCTIGFVENYMSIYPSKMESGPSVSVT